MTRPLDTVAATQRTASAGGVLRALLDHGPLARSSVARLTGLSPASVTGHTADLAERGLLCESAVEVTPSKRGRPHVPIDLDTSRHIAAAVHIAVEHSTVALFDLRGQVLAQRILPHRGLDPDTVLERAAAGIRTLLGGAGAGRTVLGLGVATGGWVDPEAGLVVDHPLLGWRDVPVARILERRLGLRVRVDSHARAMVRAEQLFGHPGTRRSAVTLFVGHVVDAAFSTGDQVHHGFRAQAGGVAHLPVAGSTQPCSCGRIGCLQATVSERRLVRRAQARGVIERASLGELIVAAEAGHAGALDLFRERATLVGQAVAMLMDVFNPELAVVVEPGVARFDTALAALREEAGRLSCSGRDLEKTVVPTSFPDTTLAVAAGAVLLDVLFRDPLALAGSYSQAS